MKAIATLETVDYVVLSKDYSATKVIRKIKPNFYVKGKEYTENQNDITGKIAIERKEVKKFGGKIFFTQGLTYSSSNIINNEFFYNKDQSQFINTLKKKYSLKTIVNFFDKLIENIPLVVGEAIIDDYVFCKAIGKSGKEPYMVMQEKKSEKYLGGSLAIAQNLAAISKKVNLLTAIGDSHNYKQKIEKELRENINFNYVLKKNSSTIVKKRFIEEINNTKLLGLYNVDDEKKSPKEDQLIIKIYKQLIKKSDLIVISDYGHGFFSQKIKKEILKKKLFLAINVQINAFSYGYSTITNYKKADLVLMNETELRQEFRDKNSDRIDLIKQLENKIKCKFIAITHGKDGATIYSTANKEIVQVPAFAKQVIDKIGAGDALFPILATCLKSKIPMDISIFIASISAAINTENYANKSLLSKVYFKKILEHSLK
jgi:rfaE bifunctional protein kinase chain/domain